jgi:predicted  nucleic acid-binding Zn-ribbon protein
MEAEIREAQKVEEIVEHVRDAVAAIVVESLTEVIEIQDEAKRTIARFDGITSELAALKVEKHSLTHDLQEIPERINKARLDGLVPDGGGENPSELERRYIQVSERLPAANARIGKLESELSSLTAGGSRPARVNPNGGTRKLLKHNATSPALDALNEAMATLNDLHKALEEVVPQGGEELRRVRQRMLDSQNTLWGQSKA